MGDSLNNAFETLKNVLPIDAIVGMLNGLVNSLPAPILELYNSNKIACLIGVVCILALLAFEGYKIFKMVLYAGGALGFGLIGLWYITPVIPADIKAMVPAIVDADVLVAVLMALLALFLCKVAQPLMIMILGGITGYLIGSTFVYTLLLNQFNTLEFLQVAAVKHIVGGAIASVMVLIFLLFFKHLYIFATSFGGTIGAALLLQSILLPLADDSMKISCIILAIAVGVFALSRQYQEEEKAMELVF